MTETSIRPNPHNSPIAVNPLRSTAFMGSSEIPESKIPWKRKGVEYQYGIFGLHNEIKDFISYIKPTPEEQWVRELVIARVQSIIYQLWPSCKIEVCGSFKTNLYLPTSDIDMVIFGMWEVLPLETLKNHLENSGLTSSIKVLSRATVPIVKLTDKETDIQIDISFNMTNSIRAVCLIKDYIDVHPCLPHLVLVLKQFLFQRDLNEVWTGGLGSYALILMCVSFLQHNSNSGLSPEDINLGTILVEFLELYGRRFNYYYAGIRVRSGGSYVPKDKLYKYTEFLCIEDPLDPDNDLGRRSYAMLQVKQAFEYAYVVLSSSVLPQYHFIHSSTSSTILGKIIEISQRTLDQRERIADYAAKKFLRISLQFPPLTALHPSFIMNQRSGGTAGISGNVHSNGSFQILTSNQNNVIAPGINPPMVIYSNNMLNGAAQILPLSSSALQLQTNQSRLISHGNNVPTTICSYSGVYPGQPMQMHSSVPGNPTIPIVTVCPNGQLLPMYQPNAQLASEKNNSKSGDEDDITSDRDNNDDQGVMEAEPKKVNVFKLPRKDTIDEDSSQPSSEEYLRLSSSQTSTHEEATTSGSNTGIANNLGDPIGGNLNYKRSRRYSRRQLNNNMYSDATDQPSVKGAYSISNDPSVISNESNPNVSALGDRLGSSSDDDLESNVTKSSINLPVISADKKHTSSPAFHKSASQTGITSSNQGGVKRKRITRKTRTQRSQMN